MGRIKDDGLYPKDTQLSGKEKVIGSDVDNNGVTMNYQLSDIRDYFILGLSPEVGGVLKITEISYSGGLTTPEEVVNQLDPSYVVESYEIVIINVNGDKYQLKLQDVTIGDSEDPVQDTDFIALSLNGSNLSNKTSFFKGYNPATGREEHYSFASTGLNISKELAGLNETGVIEIEQTEQDNLGDGVKIYKGFNTNTKKQEFYTISSPDHDVAIVGNEVVISNPASTDVEQYIVNNTYVGTEEIGTFSKPFKDIPQALLAYVGSGTNITPENDGAQIIVQRGNPYDFTGNLVYKNLNLLLDGAVINSTPTVGSYLIDYDSVSDIGSLIKITLNNGARLNVNKKLINTKGNLTSSIGVSKNIEILGDGTGIIYNAPDVSVVSPSTKSLFDINTANTAGYTSDIVLSVHDISIVSVNSPVYIKNGNQTFSLTDCYIEYGTTVAANINVDSTPFNLLGGTTLEKGNLITVYQIVGDNINKLFRLSGSSTTLFQDDITIQGGGIEYIYSNETAGAYSKLVINNLRTSNIINSGFADSSVIWNNVLMRNSTLNICPIDYTKVKLSPVAVNIINNQLVETLNTYDSKEVAISNGLFKGCRYIKRTVVTTGNFIVGEDYEILNVGNTNFTLIGASSNTTGVIFTATGVGGGTTGTAYLDKPDTV